MGLLVVLLFLYWPAVTLQGVFYVGDIYRLGYPARYEYAQGLQSGHVPLWTSRALAGFPTLAEGQTGAYYPLNLLLYRLLPLPVAINYSVLVALWVGGVGLFLYARAIGLRRVPAFLASCAFMVGGFVPGHLNHLNMLAAVSWLPLLLWAIEWASLGTNWRRWLLVSVLFGLQGLAGHPQISLLSGLLALAYAAVAPLAGTLGGFDLRKLGRRTAACVVALGLGATLAAVQWLPTYELARLSQRGQGLDAEFFTSFSLHPLHFATMLWPFARGNPYPLVSLETIGYMGALPLALAACAILLRRDRVVMFWTLIGAAAFVLSLGQWNPLYQYLRHVPVLNMFRAPARYLLWLDLAIAALAAVGMDYLLAFIEERQPATSFAVWPALSLAPLGLAVFWGSRLAVDDLVLWWRWLPVLWLAASGLLVFCALARWPAKLLWSSLAVGLLLADLAAFNAVYNQTYNAVMTTGEFLRPPASVTFLQNDAGQEPYRIYTNEEIVPVLPVMRESLYPNVQLLHGVDSLNGYYPLVPEAQQWLTENLSPRLADLLNVRYVLIPQVLPVDEEAEAYDTRNPFAPTIVGRTLEFPVQSIVAAETEGYLSHSADLATGAPVCEIVLGGADGQSIVWTLRAGVDLAEWAYTRDDVQKVIRHDLPGSVARAWPAESGFPPRLHDGLTFLARYNLTEPVEVTSVEVRPLIPAGFLHLERLRFVGSDGEERLLSDLVGEGDYVLVYRSSDVAIFRNEQAGPRAFLVHRARCAGSEEEARLLTAAPDFNPSSSVILLGGQEIDGNALTDDRVDVEVYQPEYVRLRSVSREAGYLVLADSYYPGWVACIDGRPAPVLRADVALRAVAVPAGEHVVEFRFTPVTWQSGLAISAVAWMGMALVPGAYLLRRLVGRK